MSLCTRILALSLAAGAFSLANASGAGPTPAVSAAELSNITPLAHVETRGTGPVHIVLIPEIGFDWRVFDAFMTRNADRYTMYAVTLPGFGGSPPPAVDGTWENEGWLKNSEAAVLQFIKEKQLQKPYIAGHVLGGHIAMRLAIHHPDLLAGVISIDGAPALSLGDPNKPEGVTREDRLGIARDYLEPQFQKTDIREMRTNAMASMVTDKARAAELLDNCKDVPSETLVRYTLESVASDMLPEMKSLKTPVLIVAAIPDDAAIPDPAALEVMRDGWRALVKNAPAAKLVFFENTRRFVMDDAPKELDAAFAAFIDNKEVAGKPRS